MKLVIATRNPNKLIEIREVLSLDPVSYAHLTLPTTVIV